VDGAVGIESRAVNSDPSDKRYFEFIVSSSHYTWMAFDNPDDSMLFTVGLKQIAIA